MRAREPTTVRGVAALAVTLGLLAACSGGGAGEGDDRLPPAGRPAPSPGQAPADAGAAGVRRAMLVWTAGGLPAGLSRRVAELPGVAHVVVVVSGTVWLERSRAAGGRVLDRPPPGMAIPVEVAGADPAAIGPFLSPSGRRLLGALGRGEGVLGATSARLRRLQAGGTLELGGRRLRVAGAVTDAEVGGHEVLVSRRQAAALGVRRERYLLVTPAPGTSWRRLAALVRRAVPAGTPVRVRGPGEARLARHADAVLAPVEHKARFGEFAASPRPTAGGWLTLDSRWRSRYLVTATVPLLGRVTCNRLIVPRLRAALEEVVRRGLTGAIDPRGYGGCYAPRLIPGDPGPTIAHHTWGTAVDVNVGANPLGARPRQDPRLVRVFERHGFTWGGRWLVPDGMHFEALSPSGDGRSG